MNLIHINDGELEFHLSNGEISYLFRVMEKTNVLEHLYFGKAITHRDSFDYLIEREVRPANNQFEGDLTTSLEHIKQEFPVFGTTDFRYPAIEVEYPDENRLSHFEFQKYETYKGKKVINGLPSSFSSDSDC